MVFNLAPSDRRPTLFSLAAIALLGWGLLIHAELDKAAHQRAARREIPIIGAWPRWTALALVAFTAVTLWLGPRSSLMGAVFRPRQNAEFYRTLAIMGGLLFYFASGPGTWSWKGGTGRGAKV